MTAFIVAITGNFNGFILFTFIIVIHELGHILAALYYSWNIKQVIILPFGALTIFDEKINRPLFEEFIILIMGPIFQIIGTMILSIFVLDALNYSLMILSFNLLPIFPLDGSKFINIALNKITSFKKSHILTIYVSILTIIFFIIKVKFDFLFILVAVFISIKVIEEYRMHNALYNAFLLERYIYNIKFPKRKIIKGENLRTMKRDYTHMFVKKGKYITEREALKKRFDFKSKL